MAETAKLVAVVRSDDYPYERRQLPLAVDDNLTMVLQFSDTCVGCHQGGLKQKEMENFAEQFHALTSDEVAIALMVTGKDLLSMLAQMVPCVGCRRSVEQLFNELVKCQHPALAPLVATPNSVLSVDRDYLFHPQSIYALLYVHGSQLTTVMDAIPKSKKNKRCNLHSLDTHKTKSPGSWLDAWDVLSKECREEVVLVECDALVETLDNYLRKHRFCSECKSKVQKAYGILIGDVEKTSEKGYCAVLYDGLRCCPGERHIHVSSETDFIEQLIIRAEPELVGSNRRERHAKTLDIAQEEVLTCLGIHLFERLYKIWQKVRSEEQTWQILFYLGVDALRKNFEVALEKKRGISNLELMCQEILEEEQARKQKREQKRQRRRKKKGNKGCAEEQTSPPQSPVLPLGNNNNCPKVEVLFPCQLCHDVNKNKENSPCDGEHPVCTSCEKHNSTPSSHHPPPTTHTCRCPSPSKTPPHTLTHPRCGAKMGSSCRSDGGYSSGLDGCETCSNPSSNDGSDIAFTDGISAHDEGDLRNELSCKDCNKTCSPSTLQSAHFTQSKLNWSRVCMGQHQRLDRAARSPQLSLQDMLEEGCSSEEDEDYGISEEEIRKFKANQQRLNHQRQELRRTLKQRFDHMQQQKLPSVTPDHITTRAHCSPSPNLM